MAHAAEDQAQAPHEVGEALEGLPVGVREAAVEGLEGKDLFLTVPELPIRRKSKAPSQPVNSTANISRQSGQNSESESPSDQEEELESDISSDEDDDEPLPTQPSYSALMQSLAADSAPEAKRRKLEHPQETIAAEPVEESNSVELDNQAEDPDVVEEEEEGPETEVDPMEDGDEESEDASDPFEAHFADPEDNVLSSRLKALEKNQWITQKTVLPNVGKAVISMPQTEGSKNCTLPDPISGPEYLKLKQKLAGVVAKQRPLFADLGKSIAPCIFNYQDILYCERNPTNSESLRRLACLHAVNHVFK